MIADTKHGGARPNSSRLLIHAGEKNGVRCGYLESIVNWIRALRSNTAAHGKPLPLFLQIDDLLGNHVVEINDAGPLIDVSLPAGAYQVKAQIGNVRRDYTLTLVQGASFDLHLSLARDNL